MKRDTQFPIGNQLTINTLEHDVYPALHALRKTEPVSWLPVIKAWLVTRHDLSIEVMRDAQTYTVDHPGFSTAQVVGPSMLSLDGATHQAHRSPFEMPFRKREVTRRFTAPVTAHVQALIDTLKPTGQAELRRDYAGPIAVQAMINALGLEATPVKQVLAWYDTIVQAVTLVTMGEAVSEAGQAAFTALKQTLLPSLQAQPNSSLLAAAGAMAGGLSDDQIVSNAAVLLFGGIETTEGMIANALYHLLVNPKVLAAVQADLTLVPAVIEESLRLEPAAAVVDRYTTRPVEIGGVQLPEGELVQISLLGANRDPAVFPNPDQFDPTRKNLRSHVTFAQGPHVCLGLHLARLEAQQALVQVLTNLPNLRLQSDAETQAAAKPRGLIFRKPLALNVVWDTV